MAIPNETEDISILAPPYTLHWSSLWKVVAYEAYFGPKPDLRQAFSVFHQF
jgi:hypothetical protein